MSSFKFNDLLNQLVTSVSTPEPIGVSFRGRNLKLDSEQDCDEVIQAIVASPDMTFLDLEGNTLGVDAAKAIGETLKTRKHLSRALWKDMFTGRMKTEIPLALESLTSGLQVAGARLSELDLSDNAFGPIGVQALAAFLQSDVCFGLQELRLNNNGLGTGGGKILAGALMKAFENSSAVGKPLALKVFVAGRNRLENDGASVLSGVFKALGSLEEISMPQNGIYHKGISKLSEALMSNKNLRLLNLNDNTLTSKGAKSLAAALPALQKLQVLNLGDCLLKTQGALILADALIDGHFELEEVIMDSNEIRTEGGLALVEALKNKKNLKTLCLLGNEFGEKGRLAIKGIADEFNLGDALEWPSDDDADPSEDEEEEDDDNDDDESSEEDDSVGESSEEEDAPQQAKPKETTPKPSIEIHVEDPIIKNFLMNPSPLNLEKLVEKDFNDVVKTLQTIQNVPTFIKLIMKVSDSSQNQSEMVKQQSKALAFKLYKTLFNWAEAQNSLSAVNNELFVHLQLIKGEDEEIQISWDTEKCVRVLEDAIVEKIVPEFTQHILACCLERKFKKHEEIIIS